MTFAPSEDADQPRFCRAPAQISNQKRYLSKNILKLACSVLTIITIKILSVKVIILKTNSTHIVSCNFNHYSILMQKGCMKTIFFWQKFLSICFKVDFYDAQHTQIIGVVPWKNTNTDIVRVV